jgi:hypothetical protein
MPLLRGFFGEAIRRTSWCSIAAPSAVHLAVAFMPYMAALRALVAARSSPLYSAWFRRLRDGRLDTSRDCARAAADVEHLDRPAERVSDDVLLIGGLILLGRSAGSRGRPVRDAHIKPPASVSWIPVMLVLTGRWPIFVSSPRRLVDGRGSGGDQPAAFWHQGSGPTIFICDADAEPRHQGRLRFFRRNMPTDLSFMNMRLNRTCRPR